MTLHIEKNILAFEYLTQLWKAKAKKMPFLTLTVLPSRPPKRGLMILDMESTALEAAILVSEQDAKWSVAIARLSVKQY